MFFWTTATNVWQKHEVYNSGSGGLCKQCQVGDGEGGVERGVIFGEETGCVKDGVGESNNSDADKILSPKFLHAPPLALLGHALKILIYFYLHPADYPILFQP